jgi:hypothetical protein
MLNYLVDSGVIDEGQRDAMLAAHPDYVTPFYRRGELAELEGRPRGMARFQQRPPKGVQRMKGSEFKIEAAEAAWARYTSRLVYAAHLNDALLKLAALSKEKGSARFVKRAKTAVSGTRVSKEQMRELFLRDLLQAGMEKDEAAGTLDSFLNLLESEDFVFWRTSLIQAGNLFAVRRNGKLRWFEVSPAITGALRRYQKSIGPDTTAGRWILNGFQTMANLFRALIVYMPKFMIKNVVKDFQTAWLFGNTPVAEKFKSLAPDIATMFQAYKGTFNEDARRYFMAGAAWTDLTVTAEKLSRSPEYLVKMLGGKKYPAGPKGTFQAVRDFAKNLAIGANAIEAANRLPEVRRMVAGQTANLEEIIRAGVAGEDVTVPFRRVMGWAGLRLATSVIPFLRASIHANLKIARGLADPELRRALLWKGAVMAGLSMANTAFLLKYAPKKVREKVKDMPRWRLMTGNLLWIPGTEKVIWIPTPWLPGILTSGLGNATALRLFAQDEKAFNEWARSLWQDAKPPMLPPLIGVLAELKYDIDFWRSRFVGPGDRVKRIVGPWLDGLPAEEQYEAYTSLTARRIGKFTKTSPMKVQHAINNLFGYYGKAALDASDAIDGAISGRATGVKRRLFHYWQPFSPDPLHTRYGEDFYDYYRRLTMGIKAVQHAQKLGEGTKVLQDRYGLRRAGKTWRHRNVRKERLRNRFEAARRRHGELRRKHGRMLARGASQEQLDRIREQQIGLFKSAVRAYETSEVRHSIGDDGQDLTPERRE